MGIVFHASASFLPAPAHFWIVQDSHRSQALGVLFFTAHVFRMTTFFLIAGFFAHMAFHNRGALGFIADRLKRIALPLLVGWPILFGITLAVWSATGAARTLPASFPAFPRFPLVHLWFLYVLLELYVLVLILRWGVIQMDPSGCVRAGIDRLFRVVMSGPLGAIVLAIPLFAAFAANPKWRMWFGVPTPDKSLVTNSTAVIAYGCALACGWLLHRQIGLIRNLERDWVLNLIVAIGLITACLAMVGVAPVSTPLPSEAIRLAGAACYALATWSATFAVIGMAIRFMSGFSPVRRYVADASYWVYLIHLPIVVALQVGVARLDWPWPAKLATILAVGFTLMFASYQLLVRHSFIGRALGGRPG